MSEVTKKSTKKVTNKKATQKSNFQNFELSTVLNINKIGRRSKRYLMINR